MQLTQISPSIEQIRRYLLEELPDADMTGIEERIFDDPEFLDLVRSVELDLARAYAAGTLSPAHRLVIARRIRSVPEFAEAANLVRTVGKLHSGGSTSAWLGGMRERVGQWFSAPPSALFASLAGATCMLLLMAPQLEKSQNLASATAQLEQENQRLRQANERLRVERPASPAAAEPGGPRLSAPMPPFALRLSGGATRGSADRTPSVPASPESRALLLELEIRANDDFEQYFAAIAPVGKPERRALGGVSRVVDSGRRRYVRLATDPLALNRGDYEITLFGLETGGQWSEAGHYLTRVR